MCVQCVPPEWLFHTFFFFRCLAVLPEYCTGVGTEKRRKKDIPTKTRVAYGNVFQVLINSLVCWLCTKCLWSSFHFRLWQFTLRLACKCMYLYFLCILWWASFKIKGLCPVLNKKLVLSYPPVHTSPGLPSVPHTCHWGNPFSRA